MLVTMERITRQLLVIITILMLIPMLEFSKKHEPPDRMEVANMKEELFGYTDNRAEDPP